MVPVLNRTFSPAGSFCITGSVQPTPCMFWSTCNEGTVVQTHWGFLLIVIVIDVLLTIAVGIRRVYESRRAGADWATAILPAFIAKHLPRRPGSSRSVSCGPLPYDWLRQQRSLL